MVDVEVVEVAVFLRGRWGGKSDSAINVVRTSIVHTLVCVASVVEKFGVQSS
jgi:hypothetical protein